MNSEIILKIDHELKDSLAAIRDIQNLRVAERKDAIWLRGLFEEDKLVSRLYAARFSKWYTLQNEYLFERNSHTPDQHFFETSWIPIEKFIPVSFPTPAITGVLKEPKIELKLLKSKSQQKSIGMLTTKEIVSAYLKFAPNFRWNHLKYAASDEGAILIFGTPLLPIKGTEYWSFQNCLLPNGYAFPTAAHATLFIEQEGIKGDSFLLIRNNNVFEKISEENIKPLNRQAFS